jgi:hypothetical protein
MSSAVLNIRDLGRVGVWPKDVVRIDRRTPYGNPFRMADMLWPAVAFGYRNDPEGRRAASILLYRAWLLGEPVTIPGPAAAQAVFGKNAGGTLEYSDGRVMTVGQVAQGLAGLAMVPVLEAIPLPPRPDLEPLRGKRLACWCAPLPCHGDVIVEWLESHPR